MAHQFECPSCGGLLDYPSLDELIDEYDLSDKDPHYYEDYFGDDLTVTCDWCKKRVEVPLVVPEAAPIDPLKRIDEPEHSGMKADPAQLWPSTKSGRLVLGTLAMIYIFRYLATIIVVLIISILRIVGISIDLSDWWGYY